MNITWVQFSNPHTAEITDSCMFIHAYGRMFVLLTHGDSKEKDFSCAVSSDTGVYINIQLTTVKSKFFLNACHRINMACR